MKVLVGDVINVFRSWEIVSCQYRCSLRSVIAKGDIVEPCYTARYVFDIDGVISVKVIHVPCVGKAVSLVVGHNVEINLNRGLGIGCDTNCEIGLCVAFWDVNDIFPCLSAFYCLLVKQVSSTTHP